MTEQAVPVIHIDDDRFRVTEWRFAPGAETGWHRHGHDYVVVPLADGRLALELPGGGCSEAALVRGVPYARREGVEHNVTNAGTAPLAFLEIEALGEAQARAAGDALARARLATMERLMAAFNARDLDGLMGCMADDCAFHAAAGPGAEGARHIGPAAVRAAYALIFDSFAEAAWTEGRHALAGETGLSSWRFVGRTREGKAVDLRGCDILAFDGEKIALKDSYRKAQG